MDNLVTIFDRYNSDKNSSFHNYCRQYDNLTRDYRDKYISLLELGVFTGESVKIWRDVFPNATKIVGVDINPDCKRYENPDKSIFIEIGDATNPVFIKYLNDKYSILFLLFSILFWRIMRIAFLATSNSSGAISFKDFHSYSDLSTLSP